MTNFSSHSSLIFYLVRKAKSLLFEFILIALWELTISSPELTDRHKEDLARLRYEDLYYGRDTGPEQNVCGENHSYSLSDVEGFQAKSGHYKKSRRPGLLIQTRVSSWKARGERARGLEFDLKFHDGRTQLLYTPSS
jgi:hypothetical protein